METPSNQLESSSGILSPSKRIKIYEDETTRKEVPHRNLTSEEAQKHGQVANKNRLSWIHSKNGYEQAVILVAFSALDTPETTTSDHLQELTASCYGLNRRLNIHLPHPMFENKDQGNSNCLLSLNHYVQGSMFGGWYYTRYQPRKARSMKYLLNSNLCHINYFQKLAKSAVFIRREQLFKDANHRTSILFILVCCACYRMILRHHPFEVHIIISNLHEDKWETIVERGRE